jgi:peroxidase
MVSQASMASILPGPNVDISTAIDLFGRKGINALEMVSLMGTSQPICYDVAILF